MFSLVGHDRVIQGQSEHSEAIKGLLVLRTIQSLGVESSPRLGSSSACGSDEGDDALSRTALHRVWANLHQRRSAGGPRGTDLPALRNSVMDSVDHSGSQQPLYLVFSEFIPGAFSHRSPPS